MVGGQKERADQMKFLAKRQKRKKQLKMETKQEIWSINDDPNLA